MARIDIVSLPNLGTGGEQPGKHRIEHGGVMGDMIMSKRMVAKQCFRVLAWCMLIVCVLSFVHGNAQTVQRFSRSTSIEEFRNELPEPKPLPTQEQRDLLLALTIGLCILGFLLLMFVLSLVISSGSKMKYHTPKKNSIPPAKQEDKKQNDTEVEPALTQKRIPSQDVVAEPITKEALNHADEQEAALMAENMSDNDSTDEAQSEHTHEEPVTLSEISYVGEIVDNEPLELEPLQLDGIIFEEEALEDVTSENDMVQDHIPDDLELIVDDENQASTSNQTIEKILDSLEASDSSQTLEMLETTETFDERDVAEADVSDETIESIETVSAMDPAEIDETFETMETVETVAAMDHGDVDESTEAIMAAETISAMVHEDVDEETETIAAAEPIDMLDHDDVDDTIETIAMNETIDIIDQPDDRDETITTIAESETIDSGDSLKANDSSEVIENAETATTISPDESDEKLDVAELEPSQDADTAPETLEVVITEEILDSVHEVDFEEIAPSEDSEQVASDTESSESPKEE